MEANPAYWGGKVGFSRMRFRFIPENGTRMAALEAGEVMMVNNVPPDQLARLRGNAEPAGAGVADEPHDVRRPAQ